MIYSFPKEFWPVFNFHLIWWFFLFCLFFCLQTHTLPPNYFSILNQIYFKLPWKFDIFYTKLTIHIVLIFIINLCFSPSLLLHAIHHPIYVLFVCQKGLGLFFFLVPSPAESPLLKFCCFLPDKIFGIL